MSDLIDRQAAIDAIAKLEKKHFDHPVIMCNVKTAIENLPSAEPKRGKWIIHDEGANAYECSCCGLAWCLFDGEPKDNNMNYCPKCGADMRGEENETD